MEEVLIREAVKSDYPAIRELVKQLYSDLEVKDGMEKELKRHKFERYLDDLEIIIMAAEVDGQTVGYLTINYNRALLDIGLTAIIDELVVDVDYRGKGIGTKLINKAVGIAKKSGCSEIGVGTEFENTDARAFYKKSGFLRSVLSLKKY